MASLGGGQVAPARSAAPAPVEYAVAVDRFLAAAALSAASRRIYRISLATWAWALVGSVPPLGRQRRGARPPVVPLAVLDDAGTGARLAAALSQRAESTDARTVNRELSALRSAVGWWQDQDWICHDPTAWLRHVPSQSAMLRALTGEQLDRLFSTPAALREQALWRVIHESGARAGDVLALNAEQVNRESAGSRAVSAGPREHRRSGQDGFRWHQQSSDLLRWLLAGRFTGPVFLTDRRAPAGSAPQDTCPLTGRARMSYRRAEEIFTCHTRPLDPAHRGWTLHQLRHG